MPRAASRSARFAVMLVAALAIALAACSSGGGIQQSSDARAPEGRAGPRHRRRGSAPPDGLPRGWSIDREEGDPNRELGQVEDRSPRCRG